MSRIFQDDPGFIDSIFSGLSLVGSACYISVILFLVVNPACGGLWLNFLPLEWCRLSMLAGLAMTLLVLASIVPNKAIDLAEKGVSSLLGFCCPAPLLAFAIYSASRVNGAGDAFVVLTVCLSMLCGIGAAFELSSWGNVWSKIYYASRKNRAFCAIALTLALVSVVFFCLGLLDCLVACVLCLFLLMSSTGILIFLEKRIKPFARISVDESNERYPQYARRWLAPFNAGVASGLLVSLSYSLLPYGVVPIVFACGSLVGSAVICLFVMASRRIPNLGDIDKVTIPIIGLLFALLPVARFLGETCVTLVFGLLVVDVSVYLITNWSNIALIHCKWQVNPVQNCILISSPIYLGAFIGSALMLCLNYVTSGLAFLLCIASAIMVSLVILEPVRSSYSDPDWEALYLFANNDERFEGELRESAEAELLKKRLDDFSGCYQLTPREGEVLTLLARGMNAKAVAELLFISPHTAKTHIYRIYQKAGVGTKQELLDLISSDRPTSS